MNPVSRYVVYDFHKFHSEKEKGETAKQDPATPQP